MAKILSKEDLLGFAIGSMALCTNGAGTRPTDEATEKMIDKTLAEGKEFKLISPEEIPDNSTILAELITAGGISTEQKLRWMKSPDYSAASGGVARAGLGRRRYEEAQGVDWREGDILIFTR